MIPPDTDAPAEAPGSTAGSSSDAELVLVRYGELTLKGGNRALFEEALQRNVVKACKPISRVRVERGHARMLVRPERRVGEVARRLQDVFGISSISPARGAAPEPDAITAVAAELLEDVMLDVPRDHDPTFRVATKRGDKKFPMVSTELDRYVADRVMPRYGDRLRVQLSNPEIELGIDIRRGRAYVFAQRLPGAGGLPVGTLGKAVCLLSGGIDSPVAAWMAMKRGCRVDFVSFHSYPFIGEASKRKIEQLVRALARWQPTSRLYSVPFTEIQTAIRDTAPEGYRTVLYRRAMQRIAARISAWRGAGVLVTGESLGQVASQTMENMSCIAAATDKLVMRPLVAFDKDETIRIAKRIGTFELSNIPEPDCCTVFQPRKPVIRGRIEDCERAEEEIDVEGLVRRALDGAEHIDVQADA